MTVEAWILARYRAAELRTYAAIFQGGDRKRSFLAHQCAAWRISVLTGVWPRGKTPYVKALLEGRTLAEILKRGGYE